MQCLLKTSQWVDTAKSVLLYCCTTIMHFPEPNDKINLRSFDFSVTVTIAAFYKTDGLWMKCTTLLQLLISPFSNALTATCALWSVRQSVSQVSHSASNKYYYIHSNALFRSTVLKLGLFVPPNAYLASNCVCNKCKIHCVPIRCETVFTNLFIFFYRWIYGRNIWNSVSVSSESLTLNFWSLKYLSAFSYFNTYFEEKTH